jgi:hypothetical protein
MKYDPKIILSVPCPTCGAKSGEKCELSTGLPRFEPHRDRRLATLDTPEKKHPALPIQSIVSAPEPAMDDTKSCIGPFTIEHPAVVPSIS